MNTKPRKSAKHLNSGRHTTIAAIVMTAVLVAEANHAVDDEFTNTLGMTFKPVAGTPVLFSSYETRVKDYQAFIDATGHKWEKPGFPQGDCHPVVNVSWNDACAFCEWLSKKEGRKYRLPSDHEWSVAVGIGAREDPESLPSAKDRKIWEYYWGKNWPQPKGVGNYLDLTFGKPKDGFAFGTAGEGDGFKKTAPVGSFKENPFGLFDMGGNVSEWCGDWFDGERNTRVARGADWGCAVNRYHFVKSHRERMDPDYLSSSLGFRCVLESPAGADSPGVRNTAPAAVEGEDKEKLQSKKPYHISIDAEEPLHVESSQDIAQFTVNFRTPDGKAGPPAEMRAQYHSYDSKEKVTRTHTITAEIKGDEAGSGGTWMVLSMGENVVMSGESKMQVFAVVPGLKGDVTEEHKLSNTLEVGISFGRKEPK